MPEAYPQAFLRNLGQVLSLIFLSFFVFDLAGAEVLQLSVVEKPSASRPFGKAIHFYLDTSEHKAWFAGNESFNRLSWGTYSLTNAQISPLQKLFKTWYEAAQKVSQPARATQIFRLVVHQKELTWKGYYNFEDKGLTKETSDFLRALFSSQQDSMLGAAAMDGELSVGFACETLTRDGKITVLAKNTGKKEARLNPLKDRVVALWGHPALTQGDAGIAHTLAPGTEKQLLWQLDRSVFQSAGPSAKLLFATEAWVDTGLPAKLKPLYLNVGSCELPGNLGSPTLDTPELSGPYIRLKDIEARHTKAQAILSPEQNVWVQSHEAQAKIIDACRIAKRDKSPSDMRIIKTMKQDKDSSSWHIKNMALWGSAGSLSYQALETGLNNCKLSFGTSCFVGELHCLAVGQLPAYLDENGGSIQDSTFVKDSDLGSVCIDQDDVYNIQSCYSFDGKSKKLMESGNIYHSD